MAEEADRIGRRMRERRVELGLRQREVAERIPGNTEGKDVSRWETGKHRPLGDTLEAIAKALETDVADLYAGPVGDRKPKGETPDLLGPKSDQLDRLEAKVEAALEGVTEILQRLDLLDAKRAADEIARLSAEESPPSEEARRASGDR